MIIEWECGIWEWRKPYWVRQKCLYHHGQWWILVPTEEGTSLSSIRDWCPGFSPQSIWDSCVILLSVHQCSPLEKPQRCTLCAYKAYVAWRQEKQALGRNRACFQRNFITLGRKDPHLKGNICKPSGIYWSLEGKGQWDQSSLQVYAAPLVVPPVLYWCGCVFWQHPQLQRSHSIIHQCFREDGLNCITLKFKDLKNTWRQLTSS